MLKRDGQRENVHFDKITQRIQKFCYGLDGSLDPVKIAQKVISGVFAGVTTEQLDSLAAETCAYASTKHPDYSILAARLAVSNLHKKTCDKFSETMEKLRQYKHPRNGIDTPLIAEDVHRIIMENKDRLNKEIDYNRDFGYDFFGFKTLERR